MSRVQHDLERTLHDALWSMQQCQTRAHVLTSLAEVTHTLGCSYFQVIPGPHSGQLNRKLLLSLGNLPADCRAMCFSHAASMSDPVQIAAISETAPVVWKPVFDTAHARCERRHMAYLRKHGLTNGVTIPIHGPRGCVATLVFAGSKLPQLTNWTCDVLSLYGHALIQRADRANLDQLPPTDLHTDLTLRELECLHWVLEGKTNWEIGRLTGVSARTVQFHIANAGRKMGVHTRIQAAVAALVCGELPSTAFDVDTRQLSAQPRASLLKNSRVRKHSSPYQDPEWGQFAGP